MREIKLSKIGFEEAKSISNLIDSLGVYHDQISNLTNFYPILSTEETLQTIEESISSDSSFVIGAFSEKDIVGFIQYSIDKQVGSIDRLYVGSDARGIGVGKKLMDAAMAEFEKVHTKRIDLKVVVENTSAQAFYEKYGFFSRLLVMTKIY
ncbi:GNAT family N-acetyltransferase [Enterococcus sp. LJL90]